MQKQIKLTKPAYGEFFNDSMDFFSVCEDGLRRFFKRTTPFTDKITLCISTQPKQGYKQCYLTGGFYVVDVATKRGGTGITLLTRTARFLFEKRFLDQYSTKRFYVKVEEN